MMKPEQSSLKVKRQDKLGKLKPVSSHQDVVQSQEPSASRRGICMEDLTDWWQKTAADGLVQQQEILQWWARFSQCCVDVECGSRKVLTLCERLGSAMVASTEASSRLAIDQQRAAADFFRVSQEFPRMGSPTEAQASAVRFWSGAADMARAWGMIPVSTQARTASAWAEFWSLPSAAESAS